MLKLVGSCSVIKEPVEVGSSEKGSFVKWSGMVRRSTGKKDKDGRNEMAADFYNFECWVPNDEKGNRSKEVVVPKLVKGATMVVTDAEPQFDRYKDKDGNDRDAFKIKLRSLYQVEVFSQAPAVTPEASEDEDIPF